MNRALQIAKLLALLCVCGFFVTAGLLAIRADAVLQQLQQADVAAHVNATLDAVNRPCGGKQACGTLADVAKTLGTFRGAAGRIEVADDS